MSAALELLFDQATRLGLSATEVVLVGHLIRHGVQRSLAQLTETTGLARRTIQRALDRLNQIDVIATSPGRGGAPDTHELVFLGRGVTESPRTSEAGVTESPLEAAFPLGGVTLPENPQAPSLYMSFLNLSRESEPCENPPETPNPGDEVVLFAEAMAEMPLPDEIAEGFRQLPEACPSVPPARLCELVVQKFKEKQGHPKFTLKAWLNFCRSDAEKWWQWFLRQSRKPPRRAATRFREPTYAAYAVGAGA